MISNNDQIKIRNMIRKSHIKKYYKKKELPKIAEEMIPNLKSIKKLSNNKFLVSNVWFLMLGQWYLKLKLKDGTKNIASDIPICVRKDPSGL